MLTFGFISFQKLQKLWIKTELKEVKLRYSKRTEPGKKRELSMGNSLFRFHSLDQHTTIKYPGLGEVSYPHVNRSFPLLPLILATQGVHYQVHELWKQILRNLPPFHSWSYHCSGSDLIITCSMPWSLPGFHLPLWIHPHALLHYAF